MSCLNRRALLYPTLLLLACGGDKPTPEQPQAAEPKAHKHDHHGAHEHHGKADGPLGHRFDNAEDWVDRFDGPKRDAWQNPSHVVELLQISPGMTVADIGAGTGYFLPHLSAAVGAAGTVLGLDIEQSMVEYMSKRATREKLANVRAQRVAHDDPKLAAASVDRILIVNTWHHIPGRTTYATKLAAALKPGGTIAIVDFTMESEHGPPKHHRLKPAAVIAELEAAGLRATLIEEKLADQYVVLAGQDEPANAP